VFQGLQHVPALLHRRRKHGRKKYDKIKKILNTLVLYTKKILLSTGKMCTKCQKNISNAIQKSKMFA
jgi:hypothetical protein